MIELAHTKQPYGLRLTERFVVYDPERGLHVWREFRQGQIVTDPRDIELLEARAPVEKIEA